MAPWSLCCTSYALARNLETNVLATARALLPAAKRRIAFALMFIELRLSAEPGAPSPGGLPAVVSPLHDALPLIFGQCAYERDEAAANRGGEIQVRLVEHLQYGAARVDALNDVHAIDHAARGVVPFRQDQDVALGERIDTSTDALLCRPQECTGLRVL
jgi:hypothetical protein